MRGYIATDGNYGKQAENVFSASEADKSAKSGKSNGSRSVQKSTYQSVQGSEAAGGAVSSAYSLPEGFDRLSSIVSKDDIAYWTATENGAVMASDGAEKSDKASQTDADEVMTEEEVALLKEEEDGKAKKNFVYSESSFEHMNSLLESMKKANERYKTSKKNTVKKRLKYEYQKISGTILKARTITQAGNAVYKAKSALINVRRKGASGQYDSQEVTIAANHARRMVRIAKKKLANLKEEDIHDKDGKVDEMSIKKKKSRKHAHRKEENIKLMMADLTYLKEKINHMKNGNYGINNNGSGSISVNMAMQLSFEAERQSLKEQLEEIIADSAAASVQGGSESAVSTAPVSSSGEGAAVSGTVSAASSVPAAGAGFDIMI